MVVLTIALFLTAVTLKPWDDTAVDPLPTTRADAPAQPPIALVSHPPPTQPAATPPWPAIPAGVPPRTSAAATIGRLDDLARRAGTWGVWVAGAGPRLIREEPWSDWVGVRPEPSTGAPSHVATWPGTDVCDRVPMLAGRPTVVAVTAPAQLPDARVDGWWTDGVRVATLAGSIGYLSTGALVSPVHRASPIPAVVRSSSGSTEGPGRPAGTNSTSPERRPPRH